MGSFYGRGGNTGGGGGGTSNYNELSNKPKINNVILSGNKTLPQLGIPTKTSELINDKGYITASTLPVVPTKVSDLENDAEYITMQDVPTKTSELINDKNFVTKDVDNLTNYTKTTEINNLLASKQSTILSSTLPIGGTTQTTVEGALRALNTAKVNQSEVGTANGIAELDAYGKVPASQLPSYVDDVIEGYYDLQTDRFYEDQEHETLIPPVAGVSWVDVSTNKSYRWTGSGYVRVDEGVQLGETSDTAYRGDRGKTAYDDSQTNKTNIGIMENLETQEKGSLVEAINELANSSSGGHTIKDEGTAETARTGLNFIDHDITDDSTNDNTDVAPHEITSAEWSDIMPVLPGINSGGVIFDERGTEYVVGQYIHADGTKQPIYEKSYKDIVNSQTGNHLIIVDSSLTPSNITLIKGYGISLIGTSSDGAYYAIPYNYGDAYANIGLSASGLLVRVSMNPGRKMNITVQYIKKSDTPV